jgi:carbon-monoxide dehydrogenase medium subunit
MYPPSFEYFAPTTLEEAVSILERFGDEGKVLAGGQSLIPLLKLRFAAPRALVDINRIEGLDVIAEEPGGLRIGGRVRHRACERSSLLRGRYQALGDAAPQISDPLVRNLGTVGGSLAHADPQGDWGSVMLAMGASVEVQGPRGSRSIPIADFFQGPFTTALAPAEIVTSLLVPDPGERAGGAYLKLERKVGDFATVGVAVHLALEDGRVKTAGIGLTAVGPTNLKARDAEQALLGRQLDEEAIREAAELAARAAEPKSDLRGSADYKRHIVRVFTEDGLRRAAAIAGATALAPPRPRRSELSETRCPNCGAELPAETGQHALTPSAGVATCPNCGAPVKLERPGDRQQGVGEGQGPTAGAAPPGRATGEEYFSGEESVEGVMDELSEKEGGPGE